jgi:hypothetical protein
LKLKLDLQAIWKVIWDQKQHKVSLLTLEDFSITTMAKCHLLLPKLVLVSGMKSILNKVYWEWENSLWLKLSISLILNIKSILNLIKLRILNYLCFQSKTKKAQENSLMIWLLKMLLSLAQLIIKLWLILWLELTYSWSVLVLARKVSDLDNIETQKWLIMQKIAGMLK